MAFRDILNKIKAPVKKVAQTIGSTGVLGPVGQVVSGISKTADAFKGVQAPPQGPQNRQNAPAPTDAQINQARGLPTGLPDAMQTAVNQGFNLKQKPLSSPTALAKTPNQLAQEQLANENYQFQPANVAKVVKAPTQVTTGAVVAPPTPSTAPTPQIAPPSRVAGLQEQIDAIRQGILQGTTPSEAEKAAASQLTDFQGALGQAITGLEGQGRGIPISVVRGQQGVIARQGALEQQTLEQRLATREAERQANLAAQTAQLGFLQDDITRETGQEQTQQSQLQQLALTAAQAGATPEQIQGIMGAGSFGNAIGTAAPFLRAKEDPVAALEMQKATLENQTLERELSGQLTGVDALEFSIKQLELEKKMQEASGIKTPTAKEMETLSEINKLAQDVLSSPALQATTGPLGQYLPSFRTLTGQTFNLDKDIDRLKNLLTLGNLGLMSGVLSETDIKILASSATSLDKGMTTSKFKEELQRIISKTSGQLGQQGVGQQPTQQQIDEARQQGYTDEQIQQYFQQSGFNRVGGDTNSASKVAEAIGQYESGGNYQARGPVVQSGQYRGEKAMGKYQIMPGNLPSWSKAALGRVVSEQEFMSSPQIQDAIAQYKMNELLKKYGTVEDVASVWFSGRPLAQAGNARDVIGTTVPKYVQNVSAIYNRLG